VASNSLCDTKSRTIARYRKAVLGALQDAKESLARFGDARLQLASLVRVSARRRIQPCSISAASAGHRGLGQATNGGGKEPGHRSGAADSST